MPHYVAQDDYDANADRQILDRKDLDAPTWVLVWRRLRRHRLGVFCGLFLIAIYAMLPFMEVIAPYDPNRINEDGIYAPPQGLYLYHEGEYTGLHTYATATEYDQTTGLIKPVADYTTPIPIKVFSFCGDGEYLLGMFETTFKFICPPEDGVGNMYLLGSDRLGRDVLSRILHGACLSMTIGLIGVTVSFVIGLV